jgi:hypothetical protein
MTLDDLETRAQAIGEASPEYYARWPRTTQWVAHERVPQVHTQA